MQVIFTQNVKGVAHKGEIKNVKDGYYQNYLLPNRLAILATPAKIKEAEESRKKMVIEKERFVAEAKEIQKKLEGIKISMVRKSHDDKLYAAITEKDLIDEILKKTKVKLEKENIALKGAIKKTGDFEILIKLVEGVEFKLLLEIKGDK